jgi:oligogalacturonide lyase
MFGRATHSRRWFLGSLTAASGLAAEINGKGKVFPSVVKRYPDGATEFPVTRLTDPAHSSLLPPVYARSIARHGNFLLYASDLTGRWEAFRVDLKSGQSRQLTDAGDLDPASLTLLPDDRGFCYFDGTQLMSAGFSTLHARVVYQIADGFERGHGLSVAEDGQYAAIVARKGAEHRLVLIHMTTGEATTLTSAPEEIRDPIPRPRRASILYRRAGAAWLVNYDGKQDYRLRVAEGETGPALWSPDGRDILYLNFPADPHKLHNLREFTPDSNEDRAIADTSQFVQFDANADASVFVGASASKASPHVLLLVRSVKRELTLAEHRASNPAIVSPIFSPNSQRIFFGSDLHGKPAIYTMSVEKFVEETDAGRA